MPAVIKGNENSELCARVEQSALLWIFTHSMDVRAIGDASHHRAPVFSQVCRFENVRFEIVEFMPVHGYIRSVSVVRRRIDEADCAPLGHLWRDLRPMLSVIGCYMNKSIIGAGPERSFFYRRLRQREHGVVIFNRSDVVSQRTAAWLLFGFVVARQIAADLGPALSVIGRFENALCA